MQSKAIMILRHQQWWADTSHLILCIITRLYFVGLYVAAVCVRLFAKHSAYAFKKLVPLRPCPFSSDKAELLQGLFTSWVFSTVPGLFLQALEDPPQLNHGFVPQTAHRAWESILIPDPAWNVTAQSTRNAQDSLSVRGNLCLGFKTTEQRPRCGQCLLRWVLKHVQISPHFINICVVGMFKINQLNVWVTL